jgi:transposase
MSWFRRLRYQGRGRKEKLNSSQKKQLEKMIDEGPEANGFECGCWNSALIVELVYLKFGVKYNPRYLCSLLKKLGFSYQKAGFVPDSWDKQEVEKSRKKWLKKTWPKLLSQSKAKKAVILFGDEVSFAMWGSLGRTWARRGHQPMTKTKGIRKGLKMFGAIEFQSGDFQYMESINYTLMAKSFKYLKKKEMPKETLKALKFFKNESFQLRENFTNAVKEKMGEAFMKRWETELLLSAQIAGKFNGKKYVEFLQQLIQHFSDPIILVEDGAPYHKSKVVKNFLEEQKTRVVVEPLPTFSPDFNPIEKLWKNTKRDATHLKYFKSFDQLRDSVCKAFKKYLEDATQVIRVMKKLRNEADIDALVL